MKSVSYLLDPCCESSAELLWECVYDEEDTAGGHGRVSSFSVAKQTGCGRTQLLQENLHWLDIRDHVTFKLVVVVRRCQNGRALRYLAVHCVPLSSHRHHLRFTDSTRTAAGFRHCWSVRLEQSSGSCLQSKLLSGAG